jgi:membrane protein required for colicin V production
LDPEIIRSLNWLDLLFIVIVFIDAYRGYLKGFASGCFSLCGVVLAGLISIHYYSAIALFFKQYVGLDESFLGAISFFCLSFICFLIFKFLYDGFVRLFHLQTDNKLERWGGMVLGLVRGVLLFGLLVINLELYNFEFLTHSIDRAYFARPIGRIQVSLYHRFWSDFGLKLFPAEHINQPLVEEYLQKHET